MAGWAYSNDVEKNSRWNETIEWAKTHNFPDLLEHLTESDFYLADEFTAHDIGPLGGPMYLSWNFEPKTKLETHTLEHLLSALQVSWRQVAGAELAKSTKPLAFGGRKGRRLLIDADEKAVPPWGGWSYLATDEKRRRTFTALRAAINKAIAPHEIDHIDFVHENAEESRHR